MTGGMTEAQIEGCYLAALDVRAQRKTIGEATEQVAKDTGMKFSSAKMYVNAVLAMFEGKKLGRHISELAAGWYLNRIGQDFGREAQRRAAQSLLIKVIEDTRNSKYLKTAMEVLSVDEVDMFIDGYKNHHDIWPIR